MFQLNYRDSRPIYEQIKDSFRKMIISGALEGDERLPSVRTLATQMSINPNTIQRAYNELEYEGYVYSIPGKGSFVKPKDGRDEGKITELKGKLKEIAAELKFLGVGDREIFDCIGGLG